MYTEHKVCVSLWNSSLTSAHTSSFHNTLSLCVRGHACTCFMCGFMNIRVCVCVHARSPPQFSVSVAAQKAYHACNTFPAYWSVYDPFAHQKWLWKTTIPSPVKLGKGLVVRLKRTQQEFGLNKKKRGRQRKRTDVWHFSREEKKKNSAQEPKRTPDTDAALLCHWFNQRTQRCARGINYLLKNIQSIIC